MYVHKIKYILLEYSNLKKKCIVEIKINKIFIIQYSNNKLHITYL